MPTIDRAMIANSPASPFAGQQVRFKKRPHRARRAFGRKVDELALLARQQRDAVVSAFRDQEKRKLEGWAPYRLLRSLMA